MEALANKITTYVMNKGIIKQEDYAIYQYGFQTGLESINCLVFSVVIACMLNVFAEFLIVVCVLLPLRAYLCGIHMKKYSACFICSVVLVTYGPMVAKHIILFSKFEILILSAGIMYFIHKIAFVTTKYHCDPQEVFFYAKQRKKILLGVFALLTVFFVLDVLGFMHQVLYALVVALFSVILEILLMKITVAKKDDFESQI